MPYYAEVLGYRSIISLSKITSNVVPSTIQPMKQNNKKSSEDRGWMQQERGEGEAQNIKKWVDNIGVFIK